jgi:hypothetical protein
MPDKKITQQVEHISAILGTDLLPIVGNVVVGTPTNYKVQVKNFLSQLTIDLPQTTISALHVTASATANSNTAMQAAGEFNMVANSSMAITAQDKYGLIVTNKLQNGNSNITGQFAILRCVLDSGNSNTAPANTYGMTIEHVLDANVAAARLVQPRAYLAILENAGTNAAAMTRYFADIGALGQVVSSDLANNNTTVVFSISSDRPTTHMVKCTINGQDVWLLASNTGPA